MFGPACSDSAKECCPGTFRRKDFCQSFFSMYCSVVEVLPSVFKALPLIPAEETQLCLLGHYVLCISLAK